LGPGPLFTARSDDFHMAAIERDLSGSFNRCRDRSEDVLPNAALAPARKAIVDSLVWSIFRLAVLPATSYLLNVNDAAQELSSNFGDRRVRRQRLELAI
jgi:hypothetical protein